MKLVTKRIIALFVFSISTVMSISAFSIPNDTAILSSNLLTLKNIEKNMEKYHKEDMGKKIDTLEILHNDMRQMNTYLLDIDIMLRQIMNNQIIEIQNKNKHVSLLGDKEKKEKEVEKKEQK